MKGPIPPLPRCCRLPRPSLPSPSYNQPLRLMTSTARSRRVQASTMKLKRLRRLRPTSLTKSSSAHRPYSRLTAMLLREPTCRWNAPISTRPPRSHHSTRTLLRCSSRGACAACPLNVRRRCSSPAHRLFVNRAHSLHRPPPTGRTGVTTVYPQPSGRWANRRGSLSTCGCQQAMFVPRSNTRKDAAPRRPLS